MSKTQIPETSDSYLPTIWRPFVTGTKCTYCHIWFPLGKIPMNRHACDACHRDANGYQYLQRKRHAEIVEQVTNATFDGAALRSVRIASKISQEKLATLIGLKTPDLIRRWEKGEQQPVGTYALKILIVLKISPAELLGLTD